jgi:hypothetical protein
MSITKWLPCEECDGEVLVTGSAKDDFEGWICNRCDYKANPEDYAGMTHAELVMNGLIEDHNNE